MSKQQPANARLATYFVPAVGIDREVITTDICRYLGNDALVKPGMHKNAKGETVQGYFITAYRALTTDQLTDIKADSARWGAERSRNQASRGQQGGDGYRSSATRARQQPWPQEAAAPQGTGYPAQMQQPPQNQGYDPYRNPGQQAPSSYGNQPEYNPSTNYSYGQPVPYGVAQPPPPQPRTGFPQPAAPYGDGRGSGYPPDNRAPQGYYESSQPMVPGRGQPLPPQQYQREPPQDPYYGRGQPDEAMDYDYDGDYPTEQQAAAPTANSGQTRHREREPERRSQKPRR